MKQKLFTFFFALIASVSAIYASDIEVDGIWYDFDSSTKTATVTYHGSSYDDYWDDYSGTVVIPSSVTYNGTTYSVTSIGKYAFYKCSKLTSITIPNSVTSIGMYAFYKCSSLTSPVYNAHCFAYMPTSYSGAYTIPEGIEQIAASAFYKCSSLASVTIPESVTSIGDYAFYECSKLTSITIPNSVTSIGESAFSGCSKLTSITIPNSVTSIGSSAFYDCSSLTSLTIPESVTSIGDYAFYGCSSLTSITIPESVTSIGESAFYKCSKLTSITIPNSVTSIGYGAFYNCKSLTSVTIGESVTSIGKSAFSGCSSLTSVTIPNSVTSIGDDAFSYCSSLTSVTIGESVTSIGKSAFSYCSSLTSITIPNSVTSIGKSAFSYCSSLTSITIPNSVTSIGSSAFYDCSSLTSVTIPESVTSIGDYAFYGCSSLTSITIPNSVTSIGSSAFYDCSSLTSLTIPESVTSIGDYAFYGCSSLTSVTINSDAIVNKQYSQDSNLSHIFGSQVTEYVIGDHVIGIGAYAFDGCSALTSLTIGNGVTSIRNYAFVGCSALTSLTIGNGVTSIGNYAFEDCSSLTSINVDANNANYCSIDGVLFSKDKTTLIQYPIGNTRSEYIIPNSVTSIGYDAFYGCSSLTFVTIGNSVTSIGNSAFYECSKLTSITIPNSVTSIGSNAFYNCSSLTSVTIGNGVTSIGGAAFGYCSSLTSVTIGNSVTSIGEAAFYDCSKLTSVTIGESVTSIESRAFYRCSSLTSITCEAATPPTIGGTYTFYGVSKSIPVYVPCECVEAYKAANGWEDFTNIQELLAKYSIKVYVNDTIMGTAKVNYNTFCEGAQISASPNIGYHFVQWNDGVTDNPRTLVLTQDTTLTAEFAQSFSGQCGDSLYWELVDTTLHITGKGEMYDYKSNTAPWKLLVSSIKVLTIAEDVTKLSQSFGSCSVLESIVWNAKHAADAYSDGQYVYPIFYGIRSQITSFTFGEAVEYIPAYLCDGMDKLTSVTIPNSVTSIGNRAFRDCSSLTSVHITDLAAWCNIDFVNFRANPLHIAHNLYLNSELVKDLVIPNGVTSIGNYAFDGCSSLTSVTIPNSVTSIGNSAFDGRTSLTSIICEAENPPTVGSDAFYNVSKSIPVYVPCGCVEAYKTASGWSDFTNIQVPLAEYSIEVDVNDTIMGSAKVDINNACGAQISATPNFGYHFVQWSDRNTDNPRTLELTQNTTLTAEFALNQYTVTTLASHNERGTTQGDTTVNYLDSVTITANSNYGYHFVQWNDGNSDNPRQVQVTGDTTYTATFDKNTYAISLSCNEEQGSVEGVTSAEYLDTVTISATPNIGYHLVQWSDGNTDTIRNLVLTQDTTLTAEFAQSFSGQCGDSLYWELVDTTLHITGKGEMYDYKSNTIPWKLLVSSIKVLTIAEDVTKLSQSFDSCSVLESIVWNAKHAADAYSDGQYVYPIFYGIRSQITSFTFGEAVEYIPTYLCVGMDKLTSMIIPNSVTSIGNGAFYDCSSLTSVTIPNSVTSIGYYAFRNCTSLTSITIPESVTSIENWAFEGCSSLTSMTIPESVTSIGGSAFSGCSSLTSVTVGESVTSIGDSAFEGCSAIDSIVWNAKNCADASSLETAPFYAIRSQITSFTFGENVEHISAYLCDGMEKLSSVTIPNSVKTIGTSAFEGCARLGKISLGTGLEEIAANAFAGCTRLYDIYCHAVYPPFVDESSFANYNAYLYIPCDSKRDYTLDPVWGKFQHIECLSDEPTDMENIETPSQRPTNVQKLLRNGQLLILRDGKTYNAMGQEL